MSRFTINVSFSEEQMEELKEYIDEQIEELNVSIKEFFKQLEIQIGGNNNGTN